MRSLTRALNRLFERRRSKFRGSRSDQFLNHHRRHLPRYL